MNGRKTKYMTYKDVLIEKNYTPGNLKWENPVKVIKGYDHSSPIGSATLRSGLDGELIADIEFIDGFEPKGLFPGIGWEASDDWVYENDILQAEGTVKMIGVHSSPNVDTDVPAFK